VLQLQRRAARQFSAFAGNNLCFVMLVPVLCSVVLRKTLGSFVLIYGDGELRSGYLPAFRGSEISHDLLSLR